MRPQLTVTIMALALVVQAVFTYAANKRLRHTYELLDECNATIENALGSVHSFEKSLDTVLASYTACLIRCPE